MTICNLLTPGYVLSYSVQVCDIWKSKNTLKLIIVFGDLTTELIGYKRAEKYRDSRFALFSNSFTFFHVTSWPDDKMEANFEHVLCCTKTTMLFFFLTAGQCSIQV